MSKYFNYADRQLIDYLNILKEVREFQAIMYAEQIEIHVLYKEAEDILDNQFIHSSNEYGVSRRERMFKIIPKATSSLEFRKAVLLLREMSKIPFTYRWLENKLEELVGNNFAITLTVYDLHIRLTNDQLGLINEIKNYLQEIIPANIVLTVEEIWATWGEVRDRDYIFWGPNLGEPRSGVLNRVMWRNKLTTLTWENKTTTVWNMAINVTWMNFAAFASWNAAINVNWRNFAAFHSWIDIKNYKWGNEI